jgi:hypothetical protein
MVPLQSDLGQHHHHNLDVVKNLFDLVIFK